MERGPRGTPLHFAMTVQVYVSFVMKGAWGWVLVWLPWWCPCCRRAAFFFLSTSLSIFALQAPACTPICTYMHTYMNLRTPTCTYMHTYMNLHEPTCTYMHLHAPTCTYMYIYMHLHIHLHVPYSVRKVLQIKLNIISLATL